LRFPGQYYDAETGLNYNYFRDYEPTTGRYVESDPVGLIGGPSTYAFESSSPLVWSDPLGLAPRKLDPNGEECKALARKIQNIRDNIKKRITAISFNPNDLPLIALGAPNRDSVYGHQKIVDELNDILQKRLQEYEEKCGCGGGSCPNGGGAPAPSFSPSPGGLSTPSKIGIGLGACVIAVCVLQPELCVPAVIIAG
jgi:RHS repeat-associated protein